VSNLGRDLGRGLLHLVYPGLCHLCGQPLPPGPGSVCAPCRDALLGDTSPTCPRCAATIGPFANTSGGCTHCRDDAFSFESVIRLGPYDDPWRSAVLRLKHQAGEGLAELIGELWGENRQAEFTAVQANAIVPVPLHWWRRWRRGYNQSAALAHGLASVLGLPCQTGWLRRVRHTPAQSLLPRGTRRNNVRGAFRASRRAVLRGATVLLVDDVMTTGTTAHEASAALRRAGAARVIVAALCRATA
jgi:ComF family protein